MAKELNVSESTYGKWELEHRKPDIETIVALSELFNVSVDYLIGSNRDLTAEQEKPTLESTGLALTDMLKNRLFKRRYATY